MTSIVARKDKSRRFEEEPEHARNDKTQQEWGLQSAHYAHILLEHYLQFSLGRTTLLDTYAPTSLAKTSSDIDLGRSMGRPYALSHTNWAEAMAREIPKMTV
jgi:hypothetical protein